MRNPKCRAESISGGVFRTLLGFFGVMVFFASAAFADTIRVAIADFTVHGVAPHLGQAAGEHLRTRFSGVSGLDIVERARIEEIAKEHRLQMSGLVDEATAVRTGRLVGANYIVVGSVSSIGTVIELNARLVDVERSTAVFGFSRETRMGEDGLYGVLREFGMDMISRIAPSVPDLDEEQIIVELARRGDADAQFELGRMYRDGQGVSQDERRAVELFHSAAAQGHASAQFNLGIRYERGRGVPADESQAVEWYRKAALQGHATAQFNLGVMYDNGRGVPADERQAVEWYLKAAEQDHPRAQFNLGVMHTTGRGVRRDERQAVEWYLKAANQGHMSAQFNLARMYEAGRGVQKNERQAAEWYRRAAAQGHENAAEALERLGER